MSFKRTAGAISATAAIALIMSACGAGNEGGGGDADVESDLEGTLNGAGASAQDAAVASWRAGFQTTNPDVTVNYDAIGSGGGREQFFEGGVDFAGTDSIVSEEEFADATERCGEDGLIEVPSYVSPIAVIFNVDGVDQLNLSPETIGSIFAGDITTWDDDAIAEDNPDADLPSTSITPVHRSDASGTTENFTDYLSQASDGSWTEEVSDEWPFSSGEGAQGTSGVVDAVTRGDGAIGYADASQAGDLSTAAIQVGEDFVEYSPEAASAALDASDRVEDRPSDKSIAFELDRTTTEEGAYPLILVSYILACETYDDENQADLVRNWLLYLTSQEGQEASAEGAGSAPISSDLSDEIAEIAEQISAG